MLIPRPGTSPHLIIGKDESKFVQDHKCTNEKFILNFNQNIGRKYSKKS